jgi:hypothetical protein
MGAMAGRFGGFSGEAHMLGSNESVPVKIAA